MRNWLLVAAIGIPAVMYCSVFLRAQTAAVTATEGNAALAICHKHIHPHANPAWPNGPSLLYEDGWRHCGVLAKMLWERDDRAEMQAQGAAAEEAADADKKTTRDIIRRLEAK